MGWFSKDKKRKPDSQGGKPGKGGAPIDSAGASTRPGSPDSASDEPVGIVSSVLTTGRDDPTDTPFGDVVARRFGPTRSDTKAISPTEDVADTTEATEEARREGFGSVDDGESSERATAESRPKSPRPKRHLRSIGDPLPAAVSDPDDELELNSLTASPHLEVDPMAHIGSATTITGNIVAEEDLEIQGVVEGSVRLVDHQVTIGKEGHVKASVEAHTVIVVGRITGDVIATELVEVNAGGIIGGDVRAPRVIMHDGAVVVGGLDMSASLPCGAEKKSSRDGIGPERDLPTSPKSSSPERPHLKKVEIPDDSSLEDKSL